MGQYGGSSSEEAGRQDKTEGLPQRSNGLSGKKRKRPRARTVTAAAAAEDADGKHAQDERSGAESEKENGERSKPVYTAKHSPDEGYEPAFEYLDHTADVLLHAWGVSLPAALAWLALCMYNYMTPLSEVDAVHVRSFEASGHDVYALVHNFLDELLYVFSTEFFVAKELRVLSLDTHNWRIRCVGVGETFDLSKHSQGTEVKAITYGSMQVHERADNAEVFVVVDI